jgi:hypothetical protein
MKKSGCIVITSISGPDNPVLKKYAEECRQRQIRFIVAGDESSPENFNLEGCEFLSLEKQRSLPFRLSSLLPTRNYARKNLAYLHAISEGHELLVETDDDNIPKEKFWNERSVEVSGDLVTDNTWTNIYKYFTDQPVWPRGFSLSHIHESRTKTNSGTKMFCPVQQSLADENPDVDAIYRLTLPLPIYFKERAPLVLDRNSICPFNSQNTTWFKEAFFLLYLPSYSGFRMCDIWRSFIAQRILWENDRRVSFHSATVIQKRNDHDLMKDFEQEMNGYLKNNEIMQGLMDLRLKPGSQHTSQNMMLCYGWMVRSGYLPLEEFNLLRAWIKDLSDLGI